MEYLFDGVKAFNRKDFEEHRPLFQIETGEVLNYSKDDRQFVKIE